MHLWCNIRVGKINIIIILAWYHLCEPKNIFTLPYLKNHTIKKENIYNAQNYYNIGCFLHSLIKTTHLIYFIKIQKLLVYSRGRTLTLLIIICINKKNSFSYIEYFVLFCFFSVVWSISIPLLLLRIYQKKKRGLRFWWYKLAKQHTRFKDGDKWLENKGNAWFVR